MTANVVVLFEYRNVGEHAYPDADWRCSKCGLFTWEPCPSKRERRRVGPWEPAPEKEGSR